jgi:hypothetical protein
MPAVRCTKCGAVVSVQHGADGMEVTYGSSFRESCRLLRGTASMDYSGGPGECADMQEAIERAHFRIARIKKRTSPEDVGVKPVASSSQKASRLEKAESSA